MKIAILIFMLTLPFVSYGQFGTNFHQSNLPFLGINYEIADRVRPEFRIGTDQFISELSYEGVLTYDVINREDYEFYAGLGVRINDFEGLVLPIGLNIFPFDSKNFGFHIEFAAINNMDAVRGSWGIRYKFSEK